MKSDKITADIESKREGNSLFLFFKGDLNVKTAPSIWVKVNEMLSEIKPSKLVIDTTEMKSCEGVGISLFYRCKETMNHHKGELVFQNLPAEVEEQLAIFDTDLADIVEIQSSLNPTELVGFTAMQAVDKIEMVIEFVGEVTVNFFRTLKHPFKIKWAEVTYIAETSGVNAFPIIALIGFLLGLIMSFQSAIPMRRFGAEIYVANLVSLSLFRELGPLMTAVILAGRSASSFAAEIGTMKVSEEVDALTTMGLNPVQFLVIPRILASLIIGPLLTIFFNLFGLIGSALVLLSFNFPLVTFMKQFVQAVKFNDMAGGFFKSLVFAGIISGIGCYHGLSTTSGASAVGESTTKSVVNGIIAIAIADGIFSVIFFYLGI